MLFDDIEVADYDELDSDGRDVINCDTNICSRPLVVKQAYMPKIDIKAAVEPIKLHKDNVKKMNNYG